MKIAIAGIAHETNTSCKEQTQLADFRIMRGDKLYRMRGTESQVGGALAACDELGLTPVRSWRPGRSPRAPSRLTPIAP